MEVRFCAIFVSLAAFLAPLGCSWIIGVSGDPIVVDEAGADASLDGDARSVDARSLSDGSGDGG